MISEKCIKMTSFHVSIAYTKMSSLAELSPFVDKGGLGKFYKLFSGDTEKIIEELNKELAA